MLKHFIQSNSAAEKTRMKTVFITYNVRKILAEKSKAV